MVRKGTISAPDADKHGIQDLYAAWGTTRDEHLGKMKSFIERKNAEGEKILREARVVSTKPILVEPVVIRPAAFGLTAARRPGYGRGSWQRYVLAGIQKGLSAGDVTHVVIGDKTYDVEDVIAQLQSARVKLAPRKGKLGRFVKIIKPARAEGIDLSALRGGAVMKVIETPEGKQALLVSPGRGEKMGRGMHKLRGKRGGKGPRF